MFFYEGKISKPKTAQELKLEKLAKQKAELRRKEAEKHLGVLNAQLQMIKKTISLIEKNGLSVPSELSNALVSTTNYIKGVLKKK